MKTTSLIPLLSLTLVSALPSNLPLGEISMRSLKSFSRLESVSNTLSSRESTRSGDLATRALGSSTQNDLQNGVCKPVTILFARGTTEQGNMGSVAGPPFAQAVGQAVGADNVAVQGVDYAADIPGFLAGGDAAGSQSMAQMVGQAMAACPTTKLVMAGYSQGGQLVHNAATMLSADETAFVSSAVIFGDPDNGDAVGQVNAANTKIICHTGDNICQGGSRVLQPHLTYGMDAGTAAAFVAQNVGTA